MAGVTDSPFRRVVRAAGGCGLVTMEFISSEAVTRGVEQELAKIPFHDEERPLAIQIYGSRPQAMAEAARMVEASGAEICDINMGCPAQKIVKGCSGAALLGNLPLAAAIIAVVRRALTIPLTVKMRSGLRAPDYQDLELARICQEEGVDAVTLHPRTAKQQYRGQAEWQRIALLVNELSIPVIGNGDVTEPEHALQMIEQTGCAGVMVGRAALANPWIFQQINELFHGRLSQPATLHQRQAMLRRHFDLLADAFDETLLLHKLKTFTGRYSRGISGGRKLRARLNELSDAASLRAEVERFFQAQLNP